MTLGALLISLAITFGYFVTMMEFSDVFSLKTILGTLKPLGAFGMLAAVISSSFLFFSDAVFKSWLKRIASWYVPGLLVITAATPVFSSHIMSVDRSQVVFMGMLLLILITVPFVFIARKKTSEQ